MQKIRRILVLATVFCSIVKVGNAQEILKLKKPYVYISSGYSLGVALGGYYFSNSIKGYSANELASISSSGLSAFDKKATDNYSMSARNWSDVTLISTAMVPNLFSLNKNVKQDFFTYNVVYGQALLSTIGQVMLLKAATKKNRPFVYNNEVSIADKLENDAKFSFPSGHTAIASTASYFFATTYSMYFPNSKYKKWVWIGTVLFPLVTGHLRYRAGKHFVSDIAAGYFIGAANGIIFPLIFKVGK